MKYFLVRWDISHCSDCGRAMSGDYQIFKSVKTIEEARKWVEKYYNENHPPYAIKGEKIEFDFTTTVTAKVKNDRN